MADKDQHLESELQELLDIIHFTEQASTKFYSQKSVDDLFSEIRDEFADSKRYEASIMVLTEDGKKLKVAQTVQPKSKMQAAEKVSGTTYNKFTMDLKKSKILKDIITNKTTMHIGTEEIISELFPYPVYKLISKIMGYKNHKTIITPLYSYNKVFGIVSISSTTMAEHFIPTVKSFAQHISHAVDLINERDKKLQLEEEMRETEKKERMRIGRDMHDGLGQYLTGLAFKCKAVEKRIAKLSESDAQEMSEIRDVINDSIEQVRKLSRGLVTLEVHSNMLAGDLQQIADSTKKMFGVTCTLKYSVREHVFDTVACTNIHRIVQEAITNAAVHGKADQIDIALEEKDGKLKLEIHDNGTGINEGSTKKHGVGLRIMEHRCKIMGANLSISTKKDEGTTITCRF
jgi:signal transduction histidine kinase